MVWTFDKRLGGLWKWSGCMTLGGGGGGEEEEEEEEGGGGGGGGKGGEEEEELPMPEIRLLNNGPLLTDNKGCQQCQLSAAR